MLKVGHARRLVLSHTCHVFLAIVGDRGECARGVFLPLLCLRKSEAGLVLFRCLAEGVVSRSPWRLPSMTFQHGTKRE